MQRVPSRDHPAPETSPSDPISTATHRGVDEWKVVTLLCCGLAEPEAIETQDGREALHHRLRRLETLVHHEVMRYGGTVQPMVGTQVMTVFGAPISQEDHARRAMVAALDLRRQANRKGDLGIRVGLHTGLLEVRSHGLYPTPMPTLIGETASVALALQEHAESDMILCSHETARLLRRFVRLTAIAPLRIAGWATSLPAYHAIAYRSRRANRYDPGLRRRTPLLGRISLRR